MGEQQQFPGVDLALLRLTLEGLLEAYNAKVAKAQSGAEVSALVHEYARACLREVEGVAGAELLASHYRAMFEATEVGG